MELFLLTQKLVVIREDIMAFFRKFNEVPSFCMTGM